MILAQKVLPARGSKLGENTETAYVKDGHDFSPQNENKKLKLKLLCLTV